MASINASEIAHPPPNLNRYQQVSDDASVLWLEKAQSGKVSMEDIKDALAEFTKLFKAGMASKAETLTLARAFPNSLVYTEAARKQSEKDDNEPVVVGGPASISLVDREGHLITTGALERAFQKFMANDRTRNVMVLHSDVQVGWALPAYISKGGQIFKSGVNDHGLFFICELRDDTAIAKKVSEQIHKGMLKSYSIAGSATKVQNINKGLVPYLQVDDMELAEVTICEKGVNQGAGFEILKAERTPPDKALGVNLVRKPDPPDPKDDWAESDRPPGWEKKVLPMREMIMHSNDNGTINFNKSFASWMQKEAKDPLSTKEAFVTLNNEAGRKVEHEQLLREYGFPSEQSYESMRYVPVVETETDEDGVPIHNLPPWVVNEAGEALGDRLDEDAPDYDKSDKAKARQKAGSAQKMFYNFMGIEKAAPPLPEQGPFTGGSTPGTLESTSAGRKRRFDAAVAANRAKRKPSAKPSDPGKRRPPSVRPESSRPKTSRTQRMGDLVFGKPGGKRLGRGAEQVGRGAEKVGRGAGELLGRMGRGFTEGRQQRQGWADKIEGWAAKNVPPKQGSPDPRSRVPAGRMDPMGQRNMDALHEHLGIGEGRIFSHPDFHNKSHADQRVDVRESLLNPGGMGAGRKKTLEEHLKNYSHLVSHYPKTDANGKAGDKVGHVTVNSLPEGHNAKTSMTHNAFYKLIQDGHVGFEAAPKYKNHNIQDHLDHVNFNYRDANHIPPELPGATPRQTIGQEGIAEQQPSAATAAQPGVDTSAATTGSQAFGGPGSPGFANIPPPPTQAETAQQYQSGGRGPKTPDWAKALDKMLFKAFGVRKRVNR